MGNALVISKSEKATQGVISLLKAEGYDDFKTVISATDAKRCIIESSFDLIFIYTPLIDEIGLNLSVYMAEHTSSGVFVAVSAETEAKAGEKLLNHGVVLLQKPFTAEAVHYSLRTLQPLIKRIVTLDDENKKLKAKLEEIKLVDRAKCVLMQCLALSEPQAHKYLEKQAMDLRVSKKRVAEQVLNTYEV